MKIAVASEGSIVSQHFGHCEGFTTYFVENGTATNKQFVLNPGHKPGYLPVFLREQNVNVIIAGGMGEAAKDLFVENGIEVIVGVEGQADTTAQQYAKGLLKSTGTICTEHNH
ncbi:MAG TPA: NifB/NifX family molybdenum-iron cluster-binding protein [Lachnospiraceae bacterium]|nr:NifB/NifX family molybdenum-iron cluster-binding protein [Lachnospiraceae bacterium]